MLTKTEMKVLDSSMRSSKERIRPEDVEEFDMEGCRTILEYRAKKHWSSAIQSPDSTVTTPNLERPGVQK